MWNKIVKYLPLIYGILIFSGFLNYSFYYNFFDIDVSSYLTTGELLLSFLRLTIPILTICAIFSVFIILAFFQIGLKSKDNNESTEDADFSFFLFEKINDLRNSCKQRNYRKIEDYFWTLIEIIIVLIALIGSIFFVVYIFFVGHEIVDPNPLILNSAVTIILGIFWYMLLEQTIERLEKVRKSNYSFIKYFAILLFSFSIIYIFNKEKAYNVLNEKSEYEVTINFESDTIKTNSEIVFVGKTENYLFLRNLKTKENEIINSKDVRTIKLIKFNKKPSANTQ